MKKGDKLIAIDECRMDGTNRKTLTIGSEYTVVNMFGNEFMVRNDYGEKHFFDLDDYLDIFKHAQPTDTHYNNENGSLYLFAEQHNLNAWEFDIIKRITRCRKKGQFIEDLEKTKRVIDLYIKEYDTTANR